MENSYTDDSRWTSVVKFDKTYYFTKEYKDSEKEETEGKYATTVPNTWDDLNAELEIISQKTKQIKEHASIIKNRLKGKPEDIDNVIEMDIDKPSKTDPYIITYFNIIKHIKQLQDETVYLLSEIEK